MYADTLPLLTCRSQHQRWASTLSENEQEIDFLLSVLADLPDPASYRSLTAPDAYAATLHRLKATIGQLRHAVVCIGVSCTQPSPPVPCPDAHFAPLPTSNALITSVSAECDRVRDRCQSLLGELMGLNLI